VGNCLKRKHRTFKFSYGVEKCPKYAKNEKCPILTKDRDGFGKLANKSGENRATKNYSKI